MVSDDGQQQGQSVHSFSRAHFCSSSPLSSHSSCGQSVAVGAVLPIPILPLATSSITTTTTTLLLTATTSPKLLRRRMPHQRACCGPDPSRTSRENALNSFDISRNCIPHITLQHTSSVESVLYRY